jgi:hypothetical protein
MIDFFSDLLALIKAAYIVSGVVVSMIMYYFMGHLMYLLVSSGNVEKIWFFNIILSMLSYGWVIGIHRAWARGCAYTHTPQQVRSQAITSLIMQLPGWLHLLSVPLFSLYIWDEIIDTQELGLVIYGVFHFVFALAILVRIPDLNDDLIYAGLIED